MTPNGVRELPTGRRCLSAAVFLACLALYLPTLNPAFRADDSPETAATAVILGIQHPPAYPLQTLVGRLASRLPLGSEAWRLNLMAAVLGALACALLSLLAFELGGRWLLSKGEERPAAAAWGGCLGRPDREFGAGRGLHLLVPIPGRQGRHLHPADGPALRPPSFCCSNGPRPMEDAPGLDAPRRLAPASAARAPCCCWAWAWPTNHLGNPGTGAGGGRCYGSDWSWRAGHAGHR